MVEWIAMMARSPVTASWPKTTCSWASNSRMSKISMAVSSLEAPLRAAEWHKANRGSVH